MEPRWPATSRCSNDYFFDIVRTNRNIKLMEMTEVPKREEEVFITKQKYYKCM